MTNLNNNFLKLQDNYLFSTISKKVATYKKEFPDKKVIHMGIGDVFLPLPEVCIKAMQQAVSDMGKSDTFKGYGPEQGYEFLRKKIADYDYENLPISADEIFVSDGSKCDIGRIIELFDTNNTIAVPDPVYPVYVDTNVIAGRSGNFNNITNTYEKIKYLSMNAENAFIPSIPEEKVDLIYLCFPNNPTGTVLNKKELSKWVHYAKKHNSVILYDSAYEAFITDPSIPHSIYEIEDATKVAIEFRSFSKTAGFTGLRCAYTVIPNELVINNTKLIDLYRRFISTKFNGVSYVTQKAAEALYSFDGFMQVNQNINYYLNNAKIMKEKLATLSIQAFGGENSPYIWLKIPNNMKSWDFFDKLLTQANIVGTPGSGFGPSGEGYFRLTAFNSLENTLISMDRLEQLLF